LVTVDSSHLHIAPALQKPMVVVGMATNPQLRALPQVDYSTVSAGLDCQFCSSACRRDAVHPPCGNIHPEELAKATKEKLDAYRGESVSALIPLYHPDPSRLKRCLNAVARQVDEIVLGLDGAAEYPEPKMPFSCKRVRSDQRLGFAKMMNLLARHSTGRYLLLLNDDVMLDRRCVRNIKKSMQEQTAVVGSLLRYPDGRIQHGGMLWRSDLDAFDHRDRFSRKPTIRRRCEMPTVTFAAALVRRVAFYSLRGFDERYDCYWEDVDFCVKARQAGWKVVYEPRATGIHEESQTSARLPTGLRGEMWEAGKRLYLSKWGRDA